jgi:GH25 family lysozyme M1 (1,4-beta-N-acetylmuramidase)
MCGLAACAPAASVGSIDQSDTVCAAGPTVKGMDVSYYEPTIDWATVKQAGIDFAFIRATDGTGYIDPRFREYWAAAKQHGILRGAYQFFRPAQDPVAQADLLLAQIGTIEAGDLPPVIDVEVSGGLAPAQVAASVKAWIDRVQPKIGRPPIIYAGLYSWHDLTGSADMTRSPLWVAQYTTAPCPNIPLPWQRWQFWQYASTGSVDGIPGMTLDVDVFDGTRDDLVAFANGTAAPPSCGTIAPDGGEIDDGDSCFVSGGPPAYLRHVTSGGEQGDLLWTHATASAAEANFAQWNLDFVEAGRYRVEAYTATAFAQSHRATYAVTASGATTHVMLDQSAVDGWQTLGDFDFASGGAQSVHLGDNTGEAAADNLQLTFDAVRLTRLDASDSGGCSTSRNSFGAALAVLAFAVRRRKAMACA